MVVLYHILSQRHRKDQRTHRLIYYNIRIMSTSLKEIGQFTEDYCPLSTHFRLQFWPCLIDLLGFLSSIPSHTPSANSVVPMNLTTPISLLANTLIPSSSTGLAAVARERGVGDGVPTPGTFKCLVRDVGVDDLFDEGVPLRLGERGDPRGEGELAKASSLDPLAPELTREEGRLEESVVSALPVPLLAEVWVELLLADDLGADS